MNESLLSRPGEGWHFLLSGDADLEVLAKPVNFALTIPLRCWVVSVLRSRSNLDPDIEAIAVVTATYGSESYPTIGWRLRDFTRSEELEELVERSIIELLRSSTLMDFLDWMGTCQIDWASVWRDLTMDPKSKKRGTQS